MWVLKITRMKIIKLLVVRINGCSHSNDKNGKPQLWDVCKATSVTHTKRIYRNLLRKETSFVCYTSSVLIQMNIWSLFNTYSNEYLQNSANEYLNKDWRCVTHETSFITQ